MGPGKRAADETNESKQTMIPFMNRDIHRPYWKRAHRDWRMWVGVILMLASMLIYLMTGDLR
jgi:hypothetical protein